MDTLRGHGVLLLGGRWHSCSPPSHSSGSPLDTKMPTASAAFPDHPRQTIPVGTQLWGTVLSPKMLQFKGFPAASCSTFHSQAALTQSLLLRQTHICTMLQRANFILWCLEELIVPAGPFLDP